MKRTMRSGGWQVLLGACLLATSSCGMLMARMMGVTKPRPETDARELQFVRDNGVDCDYVVRPETDAARLAFARATKLGFNGILICDSAGNEIGNTNDTTCHLRLRSQILRQMKSDAPPPPALRSLRPQLDSLRCISCADPRPYSRLPLRRYVVLLGVARFIPLKPKLSDVGFIDELKKEGVRDQVSVVLVAMDAHP